MVNVPDVGPARYPYEWPKYCPERSVAKDLTVRATPFCVIELGGVGTFAPTSTMRSLFAPPAGTV